MLYSKRCYTETNAIDKGKEMLELEVNIAQCVKIII